MKTTRNRHKSSLAPAFILVPFKQMKKVFLEQNLRGGNFRENLIDWDGKLAKFLTFATKLAGGARRSTCIAQYLNFSVSTTDCVTPHILMLFLPSPKQKKNEKNSIWDSTMKPKKECGVYTFSLIKLFIHTSAGKKRFRAGKSETKWWISEKSFTYRVGRSSFEWILIDYCQRQAADGDVIYNVLRWEKHSCDVVSHQKALK